MAAAAAASTAMPVSPGRLLTHIVVVIQMVLLTTSAVWWGMCQQNDVICLSLMQSLPASFLQQPGGVATLAAIPESLMRELPVSSQEKKETRFVVSLTLQLEDANSLTWTTWSSALQAWIQNSGFDSWPLWKSAPETTVLIGGLLTEQSTLYSETNTSIVSVKVVEEIMSSTTRGSKQQQPMLELVVYVPNKSPLLVLNDKGHRSEAVIVNGNRLVSIVQYHDDSAPEAAVAGTMSYLMPFLETHGVSSDLEPWMERTASSYLHQASTELHSTYRMLQSAQEEVSITPEIDDQWLRAIQALQEGQAQFETKNWRRCMELLELCLVLLAAIRSDPSLIPALHFPIEHSLAIFAPLLFPLLLPMVAGLMREYKRYKKLNAEESTR